MGIQVYCNSLLATPITFFQRGFLNINALESDALTACEQTWNLAMFPTETEVLELDDLQFGSKGRNRIWIQSFLQACQHLSLQMRQF